MKKINTPLKNSKIEKLNAGDEILLSGTVYTARDQAHKKLVELIQKGEKLPFDLSDSVVYYAGPAPAPPHKVIGSCGPTTSSRMDKYTLSLLEEGVKGMIGKGRRNLEVKENIKKYKSVYFLATAGCGALINNKVIDSKVIAFRELGPEAIHELKIKDLPLVVGIDGNGNDVYNNQNK